jgi:hypothetical protein
MWVLGVVGCLGFVLWVGWVVSLYTPCILRGALRFLIKNLLLIKKKKKKRREFRVGKKRNELKTCLVSHPGMRMP